MSDEKQDSDITGRKIYFLFPTASVINQVITELVQQEYEVYSIKDSNRMLRYLKKYSDAVLFINIDEGMGQAEWERWIGGVNTSSPDVSIGILTSKNDEEMHKKFIGVLHVKCGITLLKVDMNKNAVKILEMMNEMNIKGRRKYLRASLDQETNASMNMPYGGDYISGTIKDISIVGFSCSFETEINLPKNAFIKDIQIKLQSVLLRVEAIVFGLREEEGQKKYVMLFTQKVDTEMRAKIRKYIQTNLQARMDSEVG